MTTLAIIVFAYVMGSIPTGYWVVKTTKGIDLLQVGSGSTGTTNVLRTAGKTAAAFVFFIDIAKGYVPVWLAIVAWSNGLLNDLPEALRSWIPFAVAITTLVGHSKSIFLKFKGGKSAATSLGCMFAMNTWSALCSFGVFVSVVAIGRIVSIASMTAVWSSVLFTYLFHGELSYIAYCALGSVYITWRHQSNIKRIMSGTEPKIGQKVSQPDSPETPNKLEKELTNGQEKDGSTKK